jgi:RecQ family ATP-dependent DNA helicase
MKLPSSRQYMLVVQRCMCVKIQAYGRESFRIHQFLGTVWCLNVLCRDLADTSGRQYLSARTGQCCYQTAKFSRKMTTFSRSSIIQHAKSHQIELKQVQLDSIENVLAKQDTIVVAKTGAGKSLIFQIATSMINTTSLGTTIIICPLVALMMDQTRAAARWGSSVFVGSAQEDKQVECHLETFRFVFLSPEKFQQNSIQRELKRMASVKLITLLVIDECHCQQSWQSFRSAFAELPSIVNGIFGDNRPPLLLMTATLPRSIQDQMSSDFKLASDTKLFRVSCDRDNLTIQIVSVSDKITQLVSYAVESKSKGKLCLIYVATPADCKSLYDSMMATHTAKAETSRHLRIRVYHGTGCSGKSQPLDAGYMTETLRQATSNELDVCICTSAFGMGIDISNVDTVVHLVPPRSIAEYAQQIGRAGRDGSQAIAVMMFHPGKISQCFSLWVANKNSAQMNQNFKDYQDMMSFVYSSQCRRKYVRKLLEDVDESVPLNNICICDNCEEAHMVQRNVAPGMKLLLTAVKEIGSPVCISRVADMLFGHAPKHLGAWDDTKSPLWGKGKEIFAPTKQNDIWTSLAAVAVHELKYLVASLHSHQAPTSGNVVAYQRLSISAAGLAHLACNTDDLLVRERFVATSAWVTIPPRCCSPRCTNKGVTQIGSELFCSKHSINSSIPCKTNDTPSAQATATTSQAMSITSGQDKPPMPHHPDANAMLVPAESHDSFTSQQSQSAFRTLSQLTPPGCYTQQRQDAADASQRSVFQPCTPSLFVQNCDISKKGSYQYDTTADPDSQYNPYMGQTYTKVVGASKIKVLRSYFLHMSL